jgi:hypothetical protein
MIWQPLKCTTVAAALKAEISIPKLEDIYTKPNWLFHNSPLLQTLKHLKGKMASKK